MGWYAGRMGWVLGESAKRIGCSERTLRRYINGGLLRGRRVAGGQLELSHAEEAYLRGHRALLGKLMAALRTERDVRLAVLFGSAATGEDTPVSDVDLLIVHRRSGGMVQAGLCVRLRRALGTPVDVVMLEQAEAQPSLLADVMREGRVLVDRDDLWGVLQERRDEILAAGAREDEQIMIGARATFAAARERLAQRERGRGAPGIVARA
jgi:predicted nucleotidyltransferase